MHLISFSPFFSSLPLLSSRDSSILSPCTLQSPLPSPLALYLFLFHFTSLHFTLRGSLLQNLTRYRPSFPFLLFLSPNFHFFPIIFSAFRFSTQIARGNATIIDHGREILYPRKGDRIISDRKRGRNIVRESDSDAHALY